MIIRNALCDLGDRLHNGLPDLKETVIWDGAWDEKAGPERLSFQPPAALVSLTGFTLTHRGQHVAPLDLRHADRTQRSLPSPTPQVRINVAVTMVSCEANAAMRARQALALTESAVPILIGAAFEDIRCANLYAPALYKAGMTALALFGWRTIELPPEAPTVDLPETARVRENVTGDIQGHWLRG